MPVLKLEERWDKSVQEHLLISGMLFNLRRPHLLIFFI